ncbi:hypothetical protein [Kitasatospora griseola]|uniref:hypothetical protein n=1 Tax=Kitasatospora griseola TaxID=2064 RepID=UPI0034422BEF
MSDHDVPMTIGTLSDLLDDLVKIEKISRNTPVVLSADPEGNRFAPLVGWCDSLYSDGETYSLPDTEASKEEKERGIVPPEDARKVIVLWPTDVFPGYDPFATPAKD